MRKKRQKVFLSDEQQHEAEQKLVERKNKNPDIYSLPASKRNVQELADLFSRVEADTNRILPKEKQRYVIYLRKSTDDEAKQIRSIPDQRIECLELANQLGITVRDDDILREDESAKVSGKRTIFSKMIAGFEAGKYHGLISWSPDRISRNMKEAGEVIELIDQEKIQSLHFKTYQFENSPNGKMLLGILFATSKQYSDKLSVDVSRGITGNIKDGKYSGTIKKGYYVDKSTGYFIPDQYNWHLLREAVDMRLHKGKANQEIADFLNRSHFSSRKDQDEPYSVVKVNKKMVGDLFGDPFYFGLYKFGKNIANLTELYDFLPLITPDEYIELNQKMAAAFDVKYAGKKTLNTRLEYGLLRGKVICDYCDKAMQFQHQEIKRGKNKGRWLISFYCRNKECQRYKTEENKHKGLKLKKSVRAGIVIAQIEWTLRYMTRKNKRAYQLHIDKVEVQLAQDRAIAQRNLTEARKDLRFNGQQYMKYQQFQIDHPDDYKKHHTGKLEHYQNLANIAKHNVEKGEAELGRLKQGLPTEQEFYELVNSYLKTLHKTTDLIEQDAICNELLSNLRVGNDAVSVITFNKPYNLLLDVTRISPGRGDRI